MTRVRGPLPAAASLFVVLFVVLLAVTASGCETMRRVSEGAYRNAVVGGAAHELAARGIELRGSPDCHVPAPRSDSAVQVTCTARTRTGEPVAVDGIAYHADTGRPYETYVLAVGGREVLHKDCLGAGCR
ncbi:hypothetical protein ACN3XK_55200 [Actinomadura welshii]